MLPNLFTSNTQSAAAELPVLQNNLINNIFPRLCPATTCCAGVALQSDVAADPMNFSLSLSAIRSLVDAMNDIIKISALVNQEEMQGYDRTTDYQNALNALTIISNSVTIIANYYSSANNNLAQNLLNFAQPIATMISSISTFLDFFLPPTDPNHSPVFPNDNLQAVLNTFIATTTTNNALGFQDILTYFTPQVLATQGDITDSLVSISADITAAQNAIICAIADPTSAKCPTAIQPQAKQFTANVIQSQVKAIPSQNNEDLLAASLNNATTQNDIYTAIAPLSAKIDIIETTLTQLVNLISQHGLCNLYNNVLSQSLNEVAAERQVVGNNTDILD